MRLTDSSFEYEDEEYKYITVFDDNDEDESSEFKTKYLRMIKPDSENGDLCFGCGDLISDRFLLRVDGQSWHMSCLRCCVCQTNLERQTSCYIKEGHIYCRTDYTRLGEFGVKCAKCFRSIQANDWVRRARDHVFHLACFACDNCKRQLSTGEEFALQEGKVLCKTHYMETLEGGPRKDSEGSQKSKTKRVRTTFTEDQVQVLQANFHLDSNPDGQDLERIAQITGLSKRVTQVWFQNSRARQKKQQQQQTQSGNTSPSSLSSPSKLSSPSNWYIGSESPMSEDSPAFSD
ncbi:LIM/homeobox protein Awh-like [Ylistrum balloti]|uniref:LIM/homeobox protein Awh-like n=1 Tax=Ylistrum balloti TaxID=509963 RepID=UPI002905DFDD|nr:LIM/homeobox protein Awh-like [Ylistrum balloti]